MKSVSDRWIISILWWMFCPGDVGTGGVEGAWRYLEHDWVATAGTYVYEPPGEVHTLVVDEGIEQMITLFHVQGALIDIDDAGVPCGFDDVHVKIEMCRRHFAEVGLWADYVEQFVR